LTSLHKCGSGFDFVQAIKKAKYPYEYQNESFNGRGIKMCLFSIGGIYYNNDGSCASILEGIGYVQ
jgi:hypothetical protein